MRSEEPVVERVEETPEVPEAVAAARKVRRIIVPWFFFLFVAAVMAWVMAWVVVGLRSLLGGAWVLYEVLIALAGMMLLWMTPVTVFSERGILMVWGFGLRWKRVAWEDVRHVLLTNFGGLGRFSYTTDSLLVLRGGELMGVEAGLTSRQGRWVLELLKERGVEVRSAAMGVNGIFR